MASVSLIGISVHRDRIRTTITRGVGHTKKFDQCVKCEQLDIGPVISLKCGRQCGQLVAYRSAACLPPPPIVGGNRLTQVHLEKWPLKRCVCSRGTRTLVPFVRTHTANRARSCHSNVGPMTSLYIAYELILRQGPVWLYTTCCV